MPSLSGRAADVELRGEVAESIALEIAHAPAFNESISTVDGHPHGHILYSWNSGYWWLRREIRRRLGLTGPDPVDAAIDRRLGVVREKGFLRLDRGRTANAESGWTERAIGHTEMRTNLPGGRHANVRTMRATIVRADGTGCHPVAAMGVTRNRA